MRLKPQGARQGARQSARQCAPVFLGFPWFPFVEPFGPKMKKAPAERGFLA